MVVQWYGVCHKFGRHGLDSPKQTYFFLFFLSSVFKTSLRPRVQWFHCQPGHCRVCVLVALYNTDRTVNCTVVGPRPRPSSSTVTLSSVHWNELSASVTPADMVHQLAERALWSWPHTLGGTAFLSSKVFVSFTEQPKFTCQSNSWHYLHVRFPSTCEHNDELITMQRAYRARACLKKQTKQDGQAISTFAKSRSRTKWSTVVASLMFIACLVAESIEHRCVCLGRPSVTLHQGQGHRTSMSI